MLGDTSTVRRNLECVGKVFALPTLAFATVRVYGSDTHLELVYRAVAKLNVTGTQRFRTRKVQIYEPGLVKQNNYNCRL